jgi:heterodisulfide reductase subunit A-like polyferredoxin
MYAYEKAGRYIIDFQDIPSPRARMPEIPVEERQQNFKEVETGLTEEAAVTEAKRCLSCRRCLGCALCWAECRPEAINFDLPDQAVALQVDKVILTSGQERRIARVIDNFGKGHMNVVTDIQLERMLAETGPTNGLILRPQDGEIPQRIGFVQAFGTVDDSIRDGVLTFGINEAITAQQRIDDVDITFIAPTMDAFIASAGNDLEKVSGIDIVNGTILEAKEVGGKRDIEVKYETDRKEKKMVFDLVVLLGQPQLPPYMEEIARQLGVAVHFGSFLDNPGDMIETDVPDVVLALDL